MKKIIIKRAEVFQCEGYLLLIKEENFGLPNNAFFVCNTVHKCRNIYENWSVNSQMKDNAST